MDFSLKIYGKYDFYANKPENPFQTMTSQKIMKIAKIVKIDKLLK